MLKRFLSIFTIALTTAFMLSAPTFAEGEDETPAVWLQISPVSNQITLDPGSTLEYDFVVENIGAEDFDCSIYAVPYSASGEDYSLNFSEETNYTQISRWISFRDASGKYASTIKTSVKAGASKTVHYRVSVPKNVPAGGQYATIFVEAGDSNQPANAITAVSRLGLIIYGRTAGETTRAAEIVDYDMSRFIAKGDVSTTTKIKNSGNVDFSATATTTVKTIFGKVLYTNTVAPSILPETERRIDDIWPDTPFMGLFVVNYKVTALAEVIEQTHLVLILPIFMIIIMLFLLTAIVLWLIIIIKKRRERKSRLIV